MSSTLHKMSAQLMEPDERKIEEEFKSFVLMIKYIHEKYFNGTLNIIYGGKNEKGFGQVYFQTPICRVLVERINLPNGMEFGVKIYDNNGNVHFAIPIFGLGAAVNAADEYKIAMDIFKKGVPSPGWYPRLRDNIFEERKKSNTYTLLG